MMMALHDYRVSHLTSGQHPEIGESESKGRRLDRNLKYITADHNARLALPFTFSHNKLGQVDQMSKTWKDHSKTQIQLSPIFNWMNGIVVLINKNNPQMTIFSVWTIFNLIHEIGIFSNSLTFSEELFLGALRVVTLLLWIADLGT